MTDLITLFGTNVYQDGQFLIIKKIDLPYLLPTVNNSGQSLLVALLLRGVLVINRKLKVNNKVLLLNNKLLIIPTLSEKYNSFEWGELHLFKRGQAIYLRKSLIIEFYKPYEND